MSPFPCLEFLNVIHFGHFIFGWWIAIFAQVLHNSHSRLEHSEEQCYNKPSVVTIEMQNEMIKAEIITRVVLGFRLNTVQ